MMGVLVSFLLLCGVTVALPVVARGDSVAAGCTGNAIVCENQLPGTPQSVWDINGAGDTDIQGFSTQISANVGDTVQFKINTSARAYKIQIYRLGYYQGNGARKVADVTPTATLPQVQPACATDPATEIYDCGTWGVSASWAIPSTAVSGVYIALLIRSDNGDSSHIPFIVRDDSSHSDIVFQTSDPTWEAYNTYGQSDFYQGLDNGRAYKVSYNRPIITRGTTEGRDFLFSNEYPMLRYMEQNGYDVSYISGLDTDIHGGLLTNHKVFTSVGHDEYWSSGQRSNVEKARDAGVSLAFFSGNEVYWHTRWEASEDGSTTANRTLVCYKDTWANAQIDPLGPTSTWRDPRWGGNGEGPENGLTGTLYMSNSDDLAITVSAVEGKLRLWRNTSLASQPAGSTTALAPHTVGYESDEDLDNGSRPAGLIDMSTTVGPTPQYLMDYGNTVLPGTTTHHLTMYRAPSGALVFGAGTIQWAWGVDSDHDGTAGPADVRMRQATMNILADMGATATTVASGLVAATKSTDTTAPTAVITSPAAGSQIPQGAQVTVSGTATDAGGGVVAGVEVSVDGGLTWHPATGTSSFTYSGILSGSGAQALQVRATDDSGNIQRPATSQSITSGCPCSLFGATVPVNPSASDSSSTTLGVKFTSSADGFITGLRFYKAVGNTGTHIGTLYSGSGTVLATVNFANETATGWQSANFANSVPVTAGNSYVAAYTAPNGHYAGDGFYFSERGHNSGTLTAPGGPSNINNGVFASGSAFPSSSYNSTNYYIDAVYSPSDITPLTAGSATPLDGSSSVPASVLTTAKFSRSVISSTIAMTLTDPSNELVSAVTSYDPISRTVTLNPTTPLKPGVTYTARLNASAPDVGPMAAPLVWSFTTAKAVAAPGVCPCTVFNDTEAPTAGPASGPAVELGAAFTADRSGTIIGVRFYKDPSNTGSHTVSLWTSGGTRVAQANVANETTSGWQEGDFSSPASITAGTVYIVSYLSPAGQYSYTPGGLGNAIDRAPLHTPGSAGRYSYGGGAPTASSSSNYFVDPVFSPAPDAPPQIVSVNPGDNATSVPVGGSITVTFNAPVQASATAITVTDPSGNTVQGTVANESVGSTLSFVPSAPLTASKRYTVTVSGALSANGTAMTGSSTTHFITSGVSTCPCSLFSSSAIPQLSDSTDSGPITVGLSFSASSSGFITGVRYYADAANTGTHTGTLYSGATALARVTFPPIQSPGWQYATFDAPVAVTAGTAYLAAVFMPIGHYSASPAFFASPYVNSPLTGQMGLYTYGSDTLPTSTFNNSNYFVDVLFSPTSMAPAAPTVSGQTPADGSVGIASSSGVSATFSGAIDPTTLQFTLTGSGGAAVPGTVSYSPTSRTATFQPIAALTNGSTYTVLLSAQSSTGTAMAAPATWSFTTAPAPAPTVSAVSPAAGANGVSPAAVVSGVFSVPIDQSTLAFTVTTQAGTSVDGTVAYDPASGTATFKPTAALAGGTTYTAVLSAKNISGGAMAAPATWSFSTATATGPAPTVTSTTPASGASGVAVGSSITGTFGATMTSSTVAFVVTAQGGSTVSGSTSYNSTTRTATFKPSTALQFSTTYSVSLTGSSTAGTAMVAPAVWSFTTVAAPVPTVSTTSPAAGATGVAVTAAVTGTFSVAVNPASSAFTVTDPSGAAVAGTVSYNSTNRIATFKPSASLGYSSTYSVSLIATGSSGGVMPTPATWSFTTVPPPVPTVTAKSPGAGATGISVAVSVTGTFSVPVDPTSLMFSVTGPTGTPVAGTVSYNSTSRVATFKPSALLGYGSTFSVSLVATGSSGGAMATPVVWSFTTVSPPVPTVSSQTPASGSTSISRTTSVSAKFSVPVNPTSISMTLTSSSGTSTAGTVSYNSTTNVVTFKPASTLGSLTTFNVSLVATGVAGGAMTAPANWSFTTKT